MQDSISLNAIRIQNRDIIAKLWQGNDTFAEAYGIFSKFNISAGAQLFSIRV